MEAPDFLVEDLLDLPNGDEIMADGFFDTSAAGISTDSSTFTAVDSCNSSASGGAVDVNFSSRSFADAQFSGELCVPYDDVAELEWLSNFVEESFSSENLQKLHLINGPGPAHTYRHQQFGEESGPVQCPSTIIRPDGYVPGKARSKLSRVAPSDWSTRLLVGPSVAVPAEGPSKKSSKKRADNSDGEVRRCLHCATEKTPQWRTGPLGPKTLCNACGVRFKSGRLVPEYRPASSPTFVATKHSNSHRKVLELRRQREHQRLHHHQQHHQQFLGHAPGAATAAGVYVGGGSDYLIHHNVGPEFRQLI
ncbi:hypothetical protein V2J09_004537 [Rumex salicifolius]